MQSRIQREPLLRSESISPRRGRANEDQIPAMGRYRAGYQDELVPGEQCVPESLLAGTGYPWPQPVGVGDGLRFHDVNAGRLNYGHRGQHMWNRVQRLEALMDRDLKNGSRRVDR